MNILKCKMCGGDIQVKENTTFGTCESCGTTSTLPKINDERKANLYNRANHYRRQNEFDKAIQAYENILNEDSSDAEAHWGIVLSRYGIEYVEDPTSVQRIPTCHRVHSDPILNDADYIACLHNASDEYTKSLYEEEAKIISDIQKGILVISNKEEPFDVFICYKETTDTGSRTKDSALAQDLYYLLTKEGYRVFFSRITLESKLGQQYEPYIFNALNSSKVMLVIGTKPEYFNAVWVKNEWSRFLSLMKKDSSRLLIPCYRDMDAYDLPDEMSMLQSQDMSKIGFMQDIVHGIKKLAGNNKTESSQSSSAGTGIIAPGVDSLIKRGFLFLEDSDWKQSTEYFNKVLDIDPEYASAYVGLLCAELKITKEDELGGCEKSISNLNNYQKAVRFSSGDFKNKLLSYDEQIKERLKQINFDRLLKEKSEASTENDYIELVQQFKEMNGFMNSDELAIECDDLHLKLIRLREDDERADYEQREKIKALHIKSKQYNGCISADVYHTVG